MFKGFSKNGNFHGLARTVFNRNFLDWNGFPVQFWLNPSEGVVLSGSLVDSWYDKVYGILHLPINSGNRSTWISSDPNFAGHPTITTIGSGSHRAVIGKGTTFEYGRGFTIASVHAVPTIGNRVDIACGSPSFSPNIGIAGTRAQWNGIGVAVNGDTVRLGTSYETTAPTIAVLTPNNIVINGVDEPITTGSAPAIADSWGKMDWIGGGGAGLGVIIADLFCFPFEANLEQALLISDLLNTKYAIY